MIVTKYDCNTAKTMDVDCRCHLYAVHAPLKLLSLVSLQVDRFSLQLFRAYKTFVQVLKFARYTHKFFQLLPFARFIFTYLKGMFTINF